VIQRSYSSGHETLRAYLPATLVERWAVRPEQPPLWGVWLEGSLMFCDISGFTAMSESLARVGKEGAELMAGVLNRFFDRMLSVADGWGGVQMKFGGDAMLLFFSDDRQAERAAAAGLEMQAAMSEFARVAVGGDTYRLKMRIAIHCGRFYSASVGQADGMLHYLLVGRDVNRTAAIEGAGEPGQVVLSNEAAAAVGDTGRLVARNGVWRLRALETPPRPATRHHAPAPHSLLKRYLMPPLVAPLISGRLAAFSGEHRRVTAVFINLLGITELIETQGEAQALAQADIYVKMLIGAVTKHGGVLAASDLAHEGDKLICLFGAPQTVEQAETAALRTVLEVDEALRASDLDLKHRIGVSSGSVFAGEIGSSIRREYTVIGDSVNLAARLMAAARPGEVLASGPTVERAGGGLDLQRLRPLRVKGKSAPVPVFRLRGAKADSALAEPEASGVLVGRETELATLLGLARQSLSQGKRPWVYLWGEPGIGKSRLTQELAGRLQGENWQRLTVSCQMHTWNTPFAAWRDALRQLLGVPPGGSSDEVWAEIEARVGEADASLTPFVTVLSELLAVPARADAELPAIDAKERRRYLTALVVALAAGAARRRPLLLLFEDAHWADAPSLELLGAVLALRAPVLVVVTSRNPTPPTELPAVAPPVNVGLRELPADAARSLVTSVSDLSDRTLETIVARAQGNPLFLQEIARMGLTSGEAIPETVNDVILARFDRLPPEQKRVLRLASVIGPSFELPALRALAGAMEQAGIDDALAELSRLGFTRQGTGEAAAYAFSHVLTREVTYETLPYAQRRQLHRRVAQRIEQMEAARLESVCELLLHHYDLAADDAKVVRYAALSGDKAAAVFATAEGTDYYQRALSALSQLGKGFEGERSGLLERVGDCLDAAGRHREAAEKFGSALEEWRGGRRRPRLVRMRERPRVREAALCRKVALSYERRSDYDESLTWLNRALEALPGRPGIVAAQIYTTKSLAMFRKGLYHQAVHWGRLGLKASGKVRDLSQRAYGHHILANSYMELGRLRQALRHDRVSARLYHELRDLPGQARANSNLGLSYQMLGMPDAALYHYDVALKADERIGNVSHAAIVRNNIGEIMLLQGRLEEAEAHLNEAVRAYQEGTGRAALAGLAEVNLSRCQQRRGDLSAAAVHLGRGLRLLRKVGAEGLLAEALLQRAELRLAAGDAAAARRDARRILRDIKSAEVRILEARAERILGRADCALGDKALGLTYLRTSVRVARRAGASYEEALSLRDLGAALWAVPGSRPQAARFLRRAITIFMRLGAVLDLAEAESLLATDSPAPMVAA
jgi:class 3 adenylate cyclase/tetratricopeptide (TPR) repeat protein